MIISTLRRLLSFHADLDNSDMNCLSELPIFSSLSAKELSRIEHLIYFRKYRKGEYLFKQETPGHALFMIMNGSVKLENDNEEEGIRILGRLAKGSFLGELALLSDGKRCFSAIAATDVQSAVFFKHDFKKFIESNPSTGMKMMFEISKILSQRLQASLCNNGLTKDQSIFRPIRSNQ